MGRVLADGVGEAKESVEVRQPAGRFDGITRNVVVAGLVSLLTDISSEMIYPILPLYIMNVLGAGASTVGLIEGIGEATASILKLIPRSAI